MEATRAHILFISFLVADSSLLGVSVTCKWTHWIDSNGYTEPDVGSFEPTSDPNESIETGSMLNPDTNVVTPYEELWRSLTASFTDKFPYAWILRSADKKTFLGRVGGDFIAMKGGDQDPVGQKGFCARRERWNPESGSWTLKYDAGDAQNLPSLPSMASKEAQAQDAFAWQESSKEGDTVKLFGQDYVVLALEKLE